jgi:hypothetical protein
MAIFSLIAKLGLDGTNFESGLKRSQSMAKGVGKEVTGHWPPCLQSTKSLNSGCQLSMLPVR